MGDALLILLLHVAGPGVGAAVAIRSRTARRAEHVWYAAVAGQVVVAPTVLLLAFGAAGAARPALSLLRQFAPDPPPVSGVQVWYVALFGTLVYLFLAGAVVGAAIALLWARRARARDCAHPPEAIIRENRDRPA
jgi:hypothetical protein